MPKKYISFTTDINEIKTHIEKLFEKIDFQIQLHEAFINQQKEVQFSNKNHDLFETNDLENKFSAS